MEKKIAVLVLLVAVVSASYEEEFSRWVIENNKYYTPEEYKYRFGVFKANSDYINNWNSKKHSSVLKMNQFGDLPFEEFKKLYLMSPITVNPVEAVPEEKIDISAFPQSKNWTALGFVSRVGWQGQCGSCWAFSAIDSVEACNKRANGGDIVLLSEQNLMDCSFSYGNQGCNGGEMTSSYEYIIHNDGVDTEASYPYKAEDGANCTYSVKNKGGTLHSYLNVTSGSEDDLQAKVNIGPTAVVVDASHPSFEFYSSGIWSDPDCSATLIDHSLTAVGWGVDENGNEFWEAKNQWGLSWGIYGFIQIARNKGNTCGVATYASMALKC